MRDFSGFRRWVAVASLCALFGACGGDDEAFPDTSSLSEHLAPIMPGTALGDRYIVVLSDGVDGAAVARAQGLHPRHVYSHALRGFAVELPPAALARLRRSPHVRFIEPDVVVQASVQTLPTGVDRVDADQNAAANIDGVDDRIDVDVAVIDTGIDLDHPDLNVVEGVNFSNVRQRGNRRGDDDNGHGSHVAGTIAALDNDVGDVGVAPGARLYAVKVLDQAGTGALSDVVEAVDWVTARADVIEVVNMSLTASGGDDTDGGDCRNTFSSLHLAICNSVHAGVVYVAAAGNYRADAAGFIPAAYDEVITVSALADFDGLPGGLGSGSYVFSNCTESEDDSFACFSNFGADVDVVAPGVGIHSTFVDGGYATSSGTSMAAPHVAGAVALHVARYGRATDKADVDAIRQALVNTGDAGPCATPNGQCADDPDGVQEPMLDLAEFVCASDSDCNDDNECTSDTCDAGGTCVFTPLADDGPCGSGAGICCGGACSTAACAGDNECGDGNECTADTCVDAGMCTARCTNVSSADGAQCSAGACCGGACCGDLCCGSVCTLPACASDTDCDDGDECTTDLCLGPGSCGASCEHAPSPDGTTCSAGTCCGGACCGDLCCGSACTVPACDSDADCSDAESCTADGCLNPGTCAAACASTWPACGAADLCCGPGCASASDPDCEPYVVEPVGPGEWPNCYSDCGSRSFLYSASPLEVAVEGAQIAVDGVDYDGLWGVIDDQAINGDHDSDFIAVRAPGRTLVEITVEPAEAGSVIDPFLEIYDPNFFPGAGVLRTGDNAAPDNHIARLVVATPYDDRPFFIQIDHADNLSGAGAGGAEYGYVVRMAASPFDPIELDVSSGGAAVAGELLEAGDIHYYRFFAAPSAQPEVAYRASNRDMVGYLAGMNTAGGRVQWRNFAVDLPTNRRETLGSEAFSVDGLGEFIFAITDWNALGSNFGSNFGYTLTVTVDGN